MWQRAISGSSGGEGAEGYITPLTTKQYLTDVSKNAKKIVIWFAYNSGGANPMVISVDFENQTAKRWYSTAWTTQAGTDVTSSWYNIVIGKDSGGVWFKASDNYFGTYVNYIAY